MATDQSTYESRKIEVADLFDFADLLGFKLAIEPATDAYGNPRQFSNHVQFAGGKSVTYNGANMGLKYEVTVVESYLPNYLAGTVGVRVQVLGNLHLILTKAFNLYNRIEAYLVDMSKLDDRDKKQVFPGNWSRNAFIKIISPGLVGYFVEVYDQPNNARVWEEMPNPARWATDYLMLRKLGIASDDALKLATDFAHDLLPRHEMDTVIPKWSKGTRAYRDEMKATYAAKKEAEKAGTVA